MDYDSRDMLVSSDFPLDKVVGYNTGSVTIPAFWFNDPVITHGLDFVPLPYLRWSFTPDFSASFEDNFVIAADVRVAAESEVGTTQLRTTNNTASPVTVYYRIIYLAPDGIVAESNETQLALDDFNLNTDYNYPKIVYEGLLTGPSDSFSHNLGYLPQVDAWNYDNGTSSRFLGSMLDQFWSSRLLVTESTLTWQTNTSLPDPNRNVYYRIYGDNI